MSMRLSTYQVPTKPDLAPVQPPAFGPRRWPRTILLVLVAIVAGAGGGVAAQRIGDATTATPAAVTVSVAPAQQLAGTPLDVATVAATVEPALVRVEARLATGGASTGTGIVLTSDGKVLTNAHVIADATRIAVYPGNSTQGRLAQVVATDRYADIALLRITGATGLPVATLASSARVQVGDDVVVMGYALNLTGSPTVTRGIVSGLNRSTRTEDTDLTGLLQTDAAISSGDSGGAMVNAAGQVIGLTTAAVTSESDFTAENVNFAIPTDTAITVLRHLGLAIAAP